jgi:RHS repeat-associated protein
MKQKYCIYDNENNLITIYYENDTNVITYMYSPDGKRLRKYENGVGRKYFYEDDNVLTEYDTNTTVQTRYTNNLKIDDIISAKRNGISEWYHKDALGSVINLTLNSQTVSQSYKYDVFGTITEQNGTSQNEMTYTGRRLDKLSGLYYYRSRYYNSSLGRWTQKDKAGFVDGPNLYLYVKSNPIIFVDPFGKKKSCEDPSEISSGRFSKLGGPYFLVIPGIDAATEGIFPAILEGVLKYYSLSWGSVINPPLSVKGGVGLEIIIEYRNEEQFRSCRENSGSCSYIEKHKRKMCHEKVVKHVPIHGSNGRWFDAADQGQEYYLGSSDQVETCEDFDMDNEWDEWIRED